LTTLLVGFDSAWTPTNCGALVGALRTYDGTFRDLGAPQVVDYRQNDGSGMYYYRARYYNATLQRFISEDPIGFQGGEANFYVYTADSPTNFFDPLGLDKKNLFKFASDFGSKYSIAGGLKALGIGTGGAGGFINDALAGNTFSGVTDLISSFGSGEGGGNNVFYNMAQGVAAGPLQGIPPVSFVYDVADLYKTVTSIPAAFGAALANPKDMEGTVRRAMRDMFFEERLLERILPDLAFLFEGFGEDVDASLDSFIDVDDALPSGLWDPEAGSVEGGVNYSEET
jgi:RHS repeat-associated protein